MINEEDPRLASVDRQIMRSAATGEGLIPITSRAQLEALAAMAQETKKYFDEGFAEMTKAEADFVRHLRVDEGYSWRAVAETCSLEWDGDWDSNQLAGMAICEKAATFFDEKYMAPPWN